MFKKLLSLSLTLVLLISMGSTVFADESKPVLPNNVTIEEYDKLISDMLKAAGDITIDRDTTISIPVQSGRLSGTVIIEEKPDLEQITKSGTELFEGIPDGKRVITTTLKADKLLGGEMVLKSHYTMKNKGMEIAVTETSASFSPPRGYTDAGTTSYIVSSDSHYFMTKGSYTMKLGDSIPLTIRVVHEVTWLAEGTISLSYYKEA